MRKRKKADREYYLKNKKKIDKYRKKWNKKNREHIRQNAKKWREKNKEHDRERKRKWNYLHPEYNKKWRKEHPNYSKECYKRCKEKNGGNCSKLRFEIFQRDNFTCHYCGRNVKEDKIKLEIDHIIPKSKKIKLFYNKEDYVTACQDCNRGKGDILLEKKNGISK